MGVFGKGSQDALVSTTGSLTTTYATVLDITDESGVLTKAAIWASTTSPIIDGGGAGIKVTVDGGTAREFRYTAGDARYVGVSTSFAMVIPFNTKFSTSLKVELRAGTGTASGRVFYSLDN